MFELELTREGAAPVVRPLGSRQMLIGRASTNDLVVSAPTMSGRHLSIWSQGQRAWVEDLGSRNGTLVNGQPIRGIVRIEPGDTIRAGPLTILLRLAEQTTRTVHGLSIEDIDARVLYPVHGERVRLGPDPGSEVHVADVEAPGAVVLVHPDGSASLGIDDDMVDLAPDVPFAVGSRTFRLRHVSPSVSVTREHIDTVSPLQLQVWMTPRIGPVAEIRDSRNAENHTISGENRVVLLYLLGRQRLGDLAAGVERDQAGWCTDDDLSIGVWGKSAAYRRNLNVLVCRLRKELREAGFDPWFIEKRNRRVRMDLDNISIHEGHATPPRAPTI